MYRPARLDPLREVTEGRAVDHRGHRSRNLVPERRQIGGGRLARFAQVAPRDVERRHPSLDGPEHLAHRDPCRGPDQLVSPRRPPLGFEDARPLEQEQDLLEVTLRDALAACDLLDGHEPLAVVDGEVEEGTDRVLTLR